MSARHINLRTTTFSARNLSSRSCCETKGCKKVVALHVMEEIRADSIILLCVLCDGRVLELVLTSPGTVSGSRTSRRRGFLPMTYKYISVKSLVFACIFHCMRSPIIHKNDYIERFAGKLYDPNSIIHS